LHAAALVFGMQHAPALQTSVASGQHWTPQVLPLVHLQACAVVSQTKPMVHLPQSSVRSFWQLSLPVVDPHTEFADVQNSVGLSEVHPHFPVTPPPPQVSGGVHCVSAQQSP